MYDAHEKSKDLEETLKDLTKEVQGLIKEKEAVEKRRTKAIKKSSQNLSFMSKTYKRRSMETHERGCYVRDCLEFYREKFLTQ